MSQAAWPTTAEVGAALTSQGLTASASLSVHVEAAIKAFEDISGFSPFLQGTSVARKYDAPEYESQTVLDLRGGFTSVTEVRIGLSYADAVGTVLVETRDYVLMPLNARERGRPYTAISFIAATGTAKDSIKVTGLPGYDSSIPSDAWLAVRDDAMARAILEMMSGASTASELSQGPVKIKYDNEEGRSKIDRWQETARCVAKRYQRVVI